MLQTAVQRHSQYKHPHSPRAMTCKGWPLPAASASSWFSANTCGWGCVPEHRHLCHSSPHSASPTASHTVLALDAAPALGYGSPAAESCVCVHTPGNAPVAQCTQHPPSHMGTAPCPPSLCLTPCPPSMCMTHMSPLCLPVTLWTYALLLGDPWHIGWCYGPGTGVLTLPAHQAGTVNGLSSVLGSGGCSQPLHPQGCLTPLHGHTRPLSLWLCPEAGSSLGTARPEPGSHERPALSLLGPIHHVKGHNSVIQATGCGDSPRSALREGEGRAGGLACSRGKEG